MRGLNALQRYGVQKRRVRQPLTLGVEAVHHGLHQVQLGFDGEVDEVRVNQDVVRRPELCVVLEEQTGRMLGAAGKTRHSHQSAVTEENEKSYTSGRRKALTPPAP